MRRRVGLWLALAAVCMAVVGCVDVSAALAVVTGPDYRVLTIPEPSTFSSAESALCGKLSCDSYLIRVTNSGSRPTSGPVTIEDTPPSGFTIDGIYGLELATTTSNGIACAAQPVARCTYSGVLGVDESVEIQVWVAVPSLPGGEVTNTVAVTGGGAPEPVVENTENMVNSGPAATGLDLYRLEIAGVDGGFDGQAGGHPFEVTATTDFATRLRRFTNGHEGGPEEASDIVHGATSSATPEVPAGEVKDVIVDLPPGFVGDTQAVARCTERQLQASVLSGGDLDNRQTACPPDSTVGMAQIEGQFTAFSSGSPTANSISPIYNLVPERGYPAEFGFMYENTAVILYASVVPSSHGYVLQIATRGIPYGLEMGNASVTFWGVPGEPAHTPFRLKNLARGVQVPVESGTGPVAFLTNPVGCASGPVSSTAMADTWQDPGSYLQDGSPDLSDPAWSVSGAVVYPSLGGCDLLGFSPGIVLSPSTSQADEPSGLGVVLQVPQASQFSPDLATPTVKNISVTFPEGFSLSPSAADGLQACTAAQIGFGSALPGSCPEASTLGTVRVSTPLLASPLEGHMYLEEPGCDPCSNADAADGNMFRLFVEITGEGVVVKQPGTVYVNPATGRVTASFLDNPQLPFSELALQLKSGLRAPLATPQSCGTFTATSDFTPWSTPVTPDATPSSSFPIDWDGRGGACPASLGLAPSFSAGTSNPDAGQFSPFTLTFGRQDREQDLAGIQVRMPPGLSGVIAGVPLCGQPQASLGTCGAASRIGTMTVAAGPGAHPFYEQGSIYLTGPYEGAPFGLSIVVPTVAGPFNLGNVVVRARIEVDPLSTALTVTSDPFPQIIDGIPLRLRTANVTIDRPGFIFNPTNCAQQHITASIYGAQGAQASVSAPFAVAGCDGLKFTPKFTVTTSAKTSRINGASLDAKLSFPAGSQGTQANIHSFKVELPGQLPSRLSTLRKACLARTFETNPGACPSASIIGIAKARSPLLPVTLLGPVYFVSHGGEAYPDLVIVLQGYGVRVDVIGSTFISKQGITSTTIKAAPDVPVSSFELYLPSGPYSALTANVNLCTTSLRMPTSYVAQNGAQLKQSTKINVTGCAKRTAKRSTRSRGAQARDANHRHANPTRRTRRKSR